MSGLAGEHCNLRIAYFSACVSVIHRRAERSGRAELGMRMLGGTHKRQILKPPTPFPPVSISAKIITAKVKG